MTDFPTGIDVSMVDDVEELRRLHPDKYASMSGLLEEAQAFLAGFEWCRRIVQTYFGIGEGGIYGVFLIRHEPVRDTVDEWLWVIVGDIPPAYIVLDDAPNPPSALDAYLREIERWVEAVENGESVEALMPVNGAPTLENAQLLDNRANLLREHVLAAYKDALSR